MKKSLPHRDIGHVPVHIVTRLKNSIPKAVYNDIIKRQKHFEENPRQKFKTPNELETVRSAVQKYYEKLLEKALHKGAGPMHLQNSLIRDLVLETWQWITKHKNVYVYAICVMSNHIHVLIQSNNGELVEIGKIMHSFKRHTARKANEILGTTGQPFWEDGYFDREVRPGRFTAVMWYILNNPVNAGLVETWEEWPGTYLNPEWKSLF